MPLIHRLTYYADGRRVHEMQAVARALLGFGAKTQWAIEACRSNDNGAQCSTTLLPVLEEKY